MKSKPSVFILQYNKSLFSNFFVLFVELFWFFNIYYIYSTVISQIFELL